MIPLLAGLRFGRGRGPLWIPIPLFLIWLLLLPLCLLALPFYVIACRALQIPAARALAAGWAVLHGLSGTQLDIDTPDVAMAIRLI